MSVSGSLSALLPQEHFPSSATAAGYREEDEDEDGDESVSASGAGKPEKHRGDEAQDDEDVMCVGSSAVAAAHFSGELNVPLTFLFPYVPVMHVSSVFQEQKC